MSAAYKVTCINALEHDVTAADSIGLDGPFVTFYYSDVLVFAIATQLVDNITQVTA